MVQKYLDNGIDVGAIDIDSGWTTGYNNFIWDTKKFPKINDLISFMKARNIRIILWVTSVINTDSSNYAEARDKGYLLKGLFVKNIKWWRGTGGLLDYTNKEAVEWWHNQMVDVLMQGIDGWKTDGTDPYVYEYIYAHGAKGHVSRTEYSNLYYGDTFNFTRLIRGKEGLIMSRPVDSKGIRMNFSPKYVMFSGWVGDQDSTFSGMKNALKNIFHSAWSKYTNFGSDIGGYRHTKGQRAKEVFIRWA